MDISDIKYLKKEINTHLSELQKGNKFYEAKAGTKCFISSQGIIVHSNYLNHIETLLLQLLHDNYLGMVSSFKRYKNGIHIEFINGESYKVITNARLENKYRKLLKEIISLNLDGDSQLLNNYKFKRLIQKLEPCDKCKVLRDCLWTSNKEDGSVILICSSCC